jgi:hypothetical protein
MVRDCLGLLGYARRHVGRQQPAWRRPRLELLEDRVQPSTVNWIGGSGDFNTAGNWSGGAVPGASDDAVINVAGITVTFSSGSDTVKSLTCNDAFVLSGGTLNAGTLQEQSGSSFTLQAGTFASTTVVNSTLTVVAVNYSTVVVAGSLTLSNSTIDIGTSDGKGFGRLYFSDSSVQLVDGADSSHTGKIVFGPNGSNEIHDNNSQGSLTLGANLTVQGADGTITSDRGMDIKGAVTADPTQFAGQTTGTITITGTNWKSDGTLTGKNGGSLDLEGTTWTTNGPIRVLGGNLTLNGVTTATAHGWTNTGTILFGGGGTLTLKSGDVGFGLPADKSGWSNTGTIGATGSTVNLGGTFTRAALGNFVRVNGPTDDTVNLTGTLNNAGLTQTFDSTTGSWYLDNGGLNGGTLKADAGYALIAEASSMLVNVTIDGSTGNFSPLDTYSQSNAITVSGSLLLSHSILLLGNVSGSTYCRLYFSDSSLQTLDGADSTHPGEIFFGPNGSNEIHDNNNQGSLTLGANLTVQGADGTITGSNNMDIKCPVTVDPTQFAGLTTGTITITGTNWKNDGTLTGKNGGSLDLEGTTWTTNGPITVQGGGNLTLKGVTTATAHGWTNTGAISFSGGGTLKLESGDAGFGLPADKSGWSNTGSIAATGSTVNLGGTFTRAALGNFVRVNGPTDDTVNLTGTLNNAGLTQTFDSTTGSWYLDSGTLNGGTLKAAAGYALIAEGGSNNNLINVTIDGSGGNASALDMQSLSNYVTVVGYLKLSNSTIQLGSSTAGTYGALYFFDSSPQMLDGVDSTHTGTIVFGAGGRPYGTNTIQDSAKSLTLGANLTVEGLNGAILGNSGLDVKAAVIADPTLLGQTTGTITVDGASLQNDGTLTAQNGGTLIVAGNNPNLANYSAGTLTGGTWQAINGGTLYIVTAPVTTLAAQFVVDGASSRILRDNILANPNSTPTSALTSLAAIAAGGSLTLQNGFNLSLPGDLSNSGSLTIGPASTVTVNGNYTQTASATLGIHIGGQASAGAFGVLNVANTPSLAGDLSIAVANGFVPGSTDSYPIMTFAANSRSTDFANKGGLSFTGGHFNPVYGNNNLTLVPSTGQAPKITSADNTTFTVGTPGSFTVTATGAPTAGLSESGALPTGVAFTDNGDGTATLGGTPAAGSAPTYSLTITAANGVGSPDVQSFTLTVAPAPGGTLIFTTAAQKFIAGQSSGTITVLMLDAQGHPSPAGSSGVVLNLSSTSSTGTFLDAAGRPLSSPSITIAAGSSTGGFEYTDSTAATPTLTVAGAGLSVTQQETVVPAPAAIIFTTAAQTLVAGEPSEIMTVLLEDASGNAMPVQGQAVTLRLSSTSSTSAFLTTTGDALAGSTITIGQGSSTASFAYTDTTAGTPTLTVSALGLSATQQETVTGGAAVAVEFTTAAQHLALARPSGTITVQLEDRSGNPAAAGSGGVTLTLASTSAGGFFLDGSGQLLSSPNSVIVPQGATSASFEYWDNQGGAPTLTVTATGLIPASQTETVTLVPLIVSADNVTFATGISDGFQVQTLGYPTAALGIHDTGSGGLTPATLPAGLTFVDTGYGAANLTGTPAPGTGGRYTYAITASNAVGQTIQTFTLTIDEPPAITSIASTTFAAGSQGSFAVQVTGYPAPGLTEFGALPSGVAFTEHAGGGSLHTIAGIANFMTGVFPITFTAYNGIGQGVTQNFTLTVAPGFASAAKTILMVGAKAKFGVTALGVAQSVGGLQKIIPPALSISPAPPPGLKFKRFLNGTATIEGTPASGTGGTYQFTIEATEPNGTIGTQSFTLTVNEAPHFTGPKSATMVAGSPSSLTVTCLGFPYPKIQALNSLPPGLTLTDNQDGTATLAGIPTGAGTYVFKIGAAATSETFSLKVVPAAKAMLSVSLASAPTSLLLNEEVAFIANVAFAGAPSSSPAGTVTFYDGSTALATVTLTGGTASVTTTALGPGQHVITAVYKSSPGDRGRSSNKVSVLVSGIAALDRGEPPDEPI